MDTVNTKQVKRGLGWIAGSLLILVLILILALGALWYWKGMNKQTQAVKADGYQAVFLQNGQVYFGKLEINDAWLVLKDVYYLQADGETQSSENLINARQNFQLVKLGSELHGPEDTMFIPRENVNFWENLKSDSKAVQAIKDFKNK